MVILGIGQDLVHVPRIARLVARWDERFMNRCFSPEERAYCLRHRDPAPHLAARFAAKEAFYKAVSGRAPTGLWFRDAEVIRDTAGPTLALSPRANALLRGGAPARIHLTLTHEADYASAVVVIETG